jgi:DNA-binding response OmpR family regulator
MENRKVLVIDTEIQFCLLLCEYFSRKGFECYYVQDLTHAVAGVESKRPELIVADKHFHQNLESSLHNIIDSSDDYDPDVFLYNSNNSTESILDDIFKTSRE